jgi:hypothetical protein
MADFSFTLQASRTANKILTGDINVSFQVAVLIMKHKQAGIEMQRYCTAQYYRHYKPECWP